MSIDVSKFYWDQCTDVKGNDRLVIMALAEYCNEQGWCFPSVAEIARRCQLSDRGTQKILAKLAAGRHIAIEANQGTRKTSGSPTHRYHLLAYQRSLNVAKGELMRSPFQIEKGEQFAAKGEQIGHKGEPASSPDPSLDPPIDPLEDDHAREEATSGQSLSSSSAAPKVERIRLPAAAIEALIQPHDPAYLRAKIAYEDNIGEAKGLVPDMLKKALRTYPPEWIPLAIERAVAANIRTWSYVEGILRNWSKEGFNGTTQRINAKQPGAQRTVPAMAGQYDWSPDTVIIPADLDLSSPAGF